MKSIRNMMKINMTSRICISSLISITVQLCFSFHGKKIVGVSCTTDYAHLYLLSAATDPSKNNQFSTTATVMVIMELAGFLVSASCIIGNVR